MKCYPSLQVLDIDLHQECAYYNTSEYGKASREAIKHLVCHKTGFDSIHRTNYEMQYENNVPTRNVGLTERSEGEEDLRKSPRNC